jgi:hypothetical protein
MRVETAFASLLALIRRIPKGDAATVAVGTVTSGAQPAVTNSGDNKDAVFNFTIPAVLITDDSNGNVSIN